MIAENTTRKTARYDCGGTILRQFPLNVYQKKLVAKLFASLAMASGSPTKAVLAGLNGTMLEELFGVILIEDGERQEELYRVPDFAERGRRFMCLFTDGKEVEVIDDFFPLNRADRTIGKLVQMVEELLKEVSDSISTHLTPQSSASHGDGEPIQESSSAATLPEK